MSCSSCGIAFGEDVSKVESILSNWDNWDIEKRNKNVELNDEEGIEISQHNVPILQALSAIFELSPLSLKSKSLNELNDFAKVFKNLRSSAAAEDPLEDAPNPFIFCSNCGELLTMLFNAFQAFVNVLKTDGELAKKLMQLQNIRENNIAENIKVEKEAEPLPKRKRGRPKRNMEVKEEPAVKAKRTRNKKPKVILPSILSDSDDDEDDEEFAVKQEMSDHELSDVEFNRVGVEEYKNESSSSPPDSPISMNLDETPRSPRPVRKSSARNKDWSSYYKNDDEFFEEAEEVEQDKGNETEVTATEAEGDDDGDNEEVEAPDSEAQKIIAKVQVAWEEDKDRDIEFDNESDEDYLPDSDLENLKTRKYKGTSAKQPVKNIYECEECGQIFGHKLSLQRHSKIHIEDDGAIYECSTCSKIFPRIENLKRHRRQSHGEYVPYKTKNSDVDLDMVLERDRKYACPVCNLAVPKADIDEHVQEKHGIQSPWKCLQCVATFSSLNDFIRHKHTHYQRPKHTCQVCQKVFRSLYHMEKHQEAIHHVQTKMEESEEDVEEPQVEFDRDGNPIVVSILPTASKYKCSECEKKYFRIEKLQEHLIIHGIGQKFKCDLCGRTFTHESSKRRHMFLHNHGTIHRCIEQDCGKEFGRKDHLIRHLDTIHGITMAHGEIVAMHDIEATRKLPKPREIPCPYCEKMVKRERMRLHLVSHTGERRHVCNMCGKKFGLRTTLRTHIQCVHQDMRRYPCTFGTCNKAFKRSNHLKDHMKLHLDPQAKPSFQCEFCDKTFRREKNLKSHFVTHFGGKDYMCEHCGKAFNRIDNMRAHVRSVHQGLQIRKKRNTATKAKKTLKEGGSDVTEKSFKLEVIVPIEGSQTEVFVADLKTVPETPEEIVSEEIVPLSSVIVTAKKPRKRKSKIVPSCSTSQDMSVAPGTIVTLAVDPSSGIGNVISTNALDVETVHIEEIPEDAQDQADQFEGQQRTTIVQLAPGQVFPESNNDEFHTTYYQYTYYHQE